MTETDNRPDVQFLHVVVVTFRRGRGAESDPVRFVSRYFDTDTGRLLFDDDPIVSVNTTTEEKVPG